MAGKKNDLRELLAKISMMRDLYFINVIWGSLWTPHPFLAQ